MKNEAHNEQKFEKCLRAKQVAQALAVSIPTVWRWTREGKLRGRKLGQRVTVWLASDVQAFLERASV